jgi:hypothetical protein
MPYTAQDLITRSWYLSGIVARNLQVPTGDQITNGLNLLNALLDFKQIEVDLIPYYQYITFPCVPSQEFYYLPYVALIESLTFNLDVVRYPMSATSRTNYFGSARVDNISTLPFSYNFDRALGGGNLALYFKPDSNYALKAMVKIFLTDVVLTTDLTNITDTVPYTFINSSNQGLDTAYIEYLRYSLASYMCQEYNVEFSAQNRATLISYQRKLMYESPPDLSIHKSSILNADQGGKMNWGFINLGRGWTSS